MPKLLWSAFPRAVALAGVMALVAATAGARTIGAQILDAEVAADSELHLLERAEAGAYQRYSITLRSRADGTELTTNKDGIIETRAVPTAEYVALWRGLLNHDLDTLEDPAPDAAAPDQSRFTVKYRAGAASGEFSAYGVDSLADERYRSIIRAVLAFAGKHSGPDR